MAKAKNASVEKINSEEELLRLRNRVTELEQEKLEKADDTDGRYMKEIQDIKKSQTRGLNNIQYRDIQDYKAIYLWHISGHNVGKRVGPLHPASAEDTFIMFANKGIKLSMTRPSEDSINSYKQTAEYKKSAEIEAKRRAGKNKSRKESEVERLTQAIGVMTGHKIVNQIKDPQEVGVGR